MDILIDDGEVKKIKFNNKVIPFMPLNPFDEYIEYKTKFSLYHNLILFSEKNYLWCYVDLFNTFKYYVLLSDEWEGEYVCKTYLQNMQKIDRKLPNIDIGGVKDIYSYAQYYNVESTMNLAVLQKEIKNAINKKSVKKDMAEFISGMIGRDYLNINDMRSMPIEEKSLYVKSLWLYLDKQDDLIEKNFRQVTYYKNVFQGPCSYPEIIFSLINEKKVSLREYTNFKFIELSKYLSINKGEL